MWAPTPVWVNLRNYLTFITASRGDTGIVSHGNYQYNVCHYSCSQWNPPGFKLYPDCSSGVQHWIYLYFGEQPRKFPSNEVWSFTAGWRVAETATRVWAFGSGVQGAGLCDLCHNGGREAGWPATSEPQTKSFGHVCPPIETPPPPLDAYSREHSFFFFFYYLLILISGLGIGTAVNGLLSHGVQTDVVELDPVVYDYAKKYFGLMPNHTAYIEDALRFVKRESNNVENKKQYEFILHDVFTGGAVPASLFTAEFFTELRSLLTDDGVIAIVGLSLSLYFCALWLHVITLPTRREANYVTNRTGLVTWNSRQRDRLSWQWCQCSTTAGCSVRICPTKRWKRLQWILQTWYVEGWSFYIYLFISASENTCTLNQADSMFLFYQPGSMWRSLGWVSQKGCCCACGATVSPVGLVGLLSVSLFCLEIAIIYRHLLPGAAGPCFSVTPWVPNDTFCDMSLEATCIYYMYSSSKDAS